MKRKTTSLRHAFWLGFGREFDLTDFIAPFAIQHAASLPQKG
jgi:hypothetical protein